MLVFDRLDPANECMQGFLQCFGMPFCNTDGQVSYGTAISGLGHRYGGLRDSPAEFFPSFLAQGLDIFARPSRAHSPNIVGSNVQVNRPDLCRVARNDHSAAALSTRELRSHRLRGVPVGRVVDG